MKILWFTNGLLPKIAEQIGVKASVNEGWLVGMSENLLSGKFNISLTVACSQSVFAHTVTGHVSRYDYRAYYEKNKNVFDPNLKNEIVHIIKEIDPDVVHIMGTEYQHAYSIMCAIAECDLLCRTVVSIQGLVSVYAKHYAQMLDGKLKLKKTIRDLLKNEGMHKSYEELHRRGEYEEKTIKLCKHVIGRTDWDKACTTLLNPEAKYYFNNEVLRPEFYEGEWTLKNCERRSIFFSQVTNPLKGFHDMLFALSIIKRKYPDVKLYAAGSSVLLEQRNVRPWRRTAYLNYLFKLIKTLQLEENVFFCGSLQANEMKDAYLKSNVFVCSSAIENSPNSIGEAMILGVPIVAAHVGGIENMMTHGVEGFIFPGEEIYMLAYYVMQIFEDDTLACGLSAHARQRALITHNSDVNASMLVDIYGEISCNK